MKHCFGCGVILDSDSEILTSCGKVIDLCWECAERLHSDLEQWRKK